MRKLLWGAAAVIAVSAPGIAHADTTGQMSLTYDNTNYHPGNSFNSYALGGAVQTDVAPNWTVQLDGRATLEVWDHSSYDYSYGYAAVHADTTFDGFDVGAFTGIQNSSGYGGTMFGVESRTAFDNISLQGSVAYANFRNLFDSWDARIDGSYFVTPNWAVNAGVAGVWWRENGGYHDNVTDLSVGTAYQFSHCPISLFANYTYSHDKPNEGDPSYHENTFKLGVQLNFGGGTMQDRTNHGASWSGAEAFNEQLQRWDY
jgi:hypothetical protein